MSCFSTGGGADEAPDLICQLDGVQGMVDALTSFRWKRHQDAVVEISEHGIVLIVEETDDHIVGDLVALIEELGQDRVLVVGHYWGAVVAWGLCMLRPDKVRALMNQSVAYRPRNPALKPVKALRMLYGT